MTAERTNSSSRWKRKTILFLVSQCITLFGSTLVQMAVIWYVTLKTSSGAWIAAFTACSCLPQFFISFIAGVWADRKSRKALIIVSDAGIAAVTLLMVLLLPRITGDTVLLTALLIMSVIRSFGAGIQTPAVNAVIPQLVPEESLMRCNGINATMQSVVQFAAPAAAGALMTSFSLGSTLLIDIGTAALGIGILAFLSIPKTKASGERLAVLSDMKLGISYAFSDKLLGKLLTVFGAFILLCVPAGFLAQLYVSREYGDTYWYLTAVELVGFAGMTAGGVLMGSWGGFKSRVKTFLLGMAAFGALALGMALSKSFYLYLALMLFYGVALTAVQTATTTLIQENAEESMQGRVFGLLGSVYSGFLPLGMAVFGPLADIVPLRLIMASSGVVLIMLALIMSLVKSFSDKKTKEE